MRNSRFHCEKRDDFSTEILTMQEESVKYRKALEDLMVRFQQESSSKQKLQQQLTDLREENLELTDALTGSSDEATNLAASLQATKDDAHAKIESLKLAIRYVVAVEKEKDNAVSEAEESLRPCWRVEPKADRGRERKVERSRTCEARARRETGKNGKKN